MSAVVEPRRPAVASLPTTAVVLLTAVATLLALWPGALSLLQQWTMPYDYNHGLIIAAISAAWLWNRRGEIARQAPRPDPVAAFALIPMLLLWFAAYRGIVHVLYQALLPAILWTAILAAAGMRIARFTAGPIAFLYFAVPIWDYTVRPILQFVSVAVTETWLGWVGVPVKIVGDTVTIPEGTFEVHDSCSGAQYFVVALAFGVLLARIHRLSPRRTATLLPIAAAAAILANWIRVGIVIWSGHVTHMQHYFVRVEHKSLGYAIFAVLLGLLMWVASRLADTAPPTAPTPRTSAPGSSASPWAPSAGAWPRNLAWVLLAASGILVTTVPAVREATGQLGGAPVLAARWSGPLPPTAAWRPNYVGATQEQHVAYDGPSGPVEVYTNLYTDQRSGRKLITYGNTLFPDPPWRIARGAAWWQPLIGAFGAAPLTTTGQLGGSRQRWTFTYTYVVGGFQTGNSLLAQLDYGILSLLHPVGSGVIAVGAPCNQTCTAARDRVRRFWRDEHGAFVARIPARLMVHQPVHQSAHQPAHQSHPGFPS